MKYWPTEPRLSFAAMPLQKRQRLAPGGLGTVHDSVVVFRQRQPKAPRSGERTRHMIDFLRPCRFAPRPSFEMKFVSSAHHRIAHRAVDGPLARPFRPPSAPVLTGAGPGRCRGMASRRQRFRVRFVGGAPVVSAASPCLARLGGLVCTSCTLVTRVLGILRGGSIAVGRTRLERAETGGTVPRPH